MNQLKIVGDISFSLRYSMKQKSGDYIMDKVLTIDI